MKESTSRTFKVSSPILATDLAILVSLRLCGG